MRTRYVPAATPANGTDSCVVGGGGAGGGLSSAIRGGHGKLYAFTGPGGGLTAGSSSFSSSRTRCDGPTARSSVTSKMPERGLDPAPWRFETVMFVIVGMSVNAAGA